MPNSQPRKSGGTIARSIEARGGHVEVKPLTAVQLVEFENDLIAHRDAEQTSLSAPPEARPHPENCRYCEVRHL